MNIGFDLDKIFINYPPTIPSWLIDRLYKEKSNGVLKYRIPGKWEQKIRQLSHLSFLRKPIQKNIAFLKTLSLQNKNKLFLISSRFGFLEKQTQDLVKRNNLQNLFNGLYFNFHNAQPHLFKEKIIKQLNIDRYIDDDLSLLNYLSKRNAQTNFFWLNDNQVGKISKNLFAVTSLKDATK